MNEILYRDYRTDGCPSDSSHLIGDDMAALLDRGLPYRQLERPVYVNAIDHGACRVSFSLRLAQARRMGYDPCEYQNLFERNGLSEEQVRETKAALLALGLEEEIVQAI